MTDDIETLFSNRVCISISDEKDGLRIRGISPDVDRYVLFSDGLLLISEERYKEHDATKEFLLKEVQYFHKNMTFDVRYVPDKYITEIYENLPKYQKGSGRIYAEMIKKRAKQLKKTLGISHHEALEILAKKEGFSCWKDVVNISESDAHYAISLEKGRKKHQ